jgi:hypothetical protein
VLIAAIIGLCVLLALLGFLLPRFSDHAKQGTDKGFSLGQRATSKAPGPLDSLFTKSLGKSQRATSKSHSAGKKTRFKLPF